MDLTDIIHIGYMAGMYHLCFWLDPDRLLIHVEEITERHCTVLALDTVVIVCGVFRRLTFAD